MFLALIFLQHKGRGGGKGMQTSFYISTSGIVDMTDQF